VIDKNGNLKNLAHKINYKYLINILLYSLFENKIEYY